MSSKKLNKKIPPIGAEVVIDVLEKNGIKHIFGIPGGTTLPIYDALYKSKIKHILTRHEQGAAHMAEGYAKASGKPGVVFATSGPGATNLTTGLVDAKLDSVPIVAVTGQVPTSVIGTDAFQEADMYGISIPCTKYNALVKKTEDLATFLQEAISLSTANRPGPTLVDIPKDIQNSLINDYDFKKIKLTIPERHLKREPVSGDLARFAKALNKSQRPLLYVGGGATISGAEKEVMKLAEKNSIPVTMTLNGLAAFHHVQRDFEFAGLAPDTAFNHQSAHAKIPVFRIVAFLDLGNGDEKHHVLFEGLKRKAGCDRDTGDGQSDRQHALSSWFHDSDSIARIRLRTSVKTA